MLPAGYRQVVHRAHRFDGNSRFYDPVLANHPNVDLSIRGHRPFKDGSPINIPAGEDGACITCDGEQEWLPMHTRRTHAITGFRQWSVLDEMNHGILANFETARGL